MRKSFAVLNFFITFAVLMGGCGNHRGEQSIEKSRVPDSTVVAENAKGSEAKEQEDLYVFWTESEELYTPEDTTLIAMNNQFY